MTDNRYDAATFQAKTNVSRETLERLRIYENLLRKWQPRINLVGPKTVDDLWRRHFWDSAQLLPLLPGSTARVADLGSGAGFPGLVLAIMGVPEVHLIESDGRKAAFLREVARATATDVRIHVCRLETVSELHVDAVMARALAPLSTLLDWATPLIDAEGTLIFPKGRNVEEELTEAERGWFMDAERFPSQSDGEATILRIRNLRRR